MIIEIKLMSGVEDGKQHAFNSDDNGQTTNDRWILSIGRHDSNDLVLINDTFVSRNHANLVFRDEVWWLEDNHSTNGTFIENSDQFFRDKRVQGSVQIDRENMFRIGRTWLKINRQE